MPMGIARGDSIPTIHYGDAEMSVFLFGFDLLTGRGAGRITSCPNY
jgi:hypothetical protein